MAQAETLSYLMGWLCHYLKNANHEDLSERLCTYLENHSQENNLPYVSRQSQQIRLKTPGEKERIIKADILVLSKNEWQRMKGSPSSAAAYIPPPGIIEVVSNNWKDDYLIQLAEYEDLGVLEYIEAFGSLVHLNSLLSPFINSKTVSTCQEK